MKWPAVVALCCATGGCADEVIGYQSGDTESTQASTSSEASSSGGASSGAVLPADSSTGADVQVLPDYVAGGFDTMIAVSFDEGRNWQEFPNPSSPVEITYEGIAHNDERIVIVGGGSTVVTTDGLTWEAFGDQLGYARAVAYGAGTFVSVGFERRARSVDGMGWIDARNGDSGFDYYAITYGDGRFVAVGVDIMGTSTDGIDWVTTPLEGPKLNALAFGNGRFVAVGEQARIAVTTDGVSFINDSFTEGEFDSICFFDGQFVTLSQSVVRFSEFGEEWTEVAIEPASTFACAPDHVAVADQQRMRAGTDLLSTELRATLSTPVNTVAYTGRP
ncbi:MAG: hypothetical protein AAF721_05490 [Myxococcota bacterium]